MTVTSALNGPSLNPASGKKPNAAVVLLHGYGSNGDDLIGLAPYFANVLPDAVFYSPNAPAPIEGGFGGGYQWFSLRNYNPDMMRKDGPLRTQFFASIAGEIAAAAAKVDTFLDDVLARHALSADRLVLIGFSQGTMMSLQVGPRRIQQIGGIVGFSGALLSPEKVAAEIKSKPPIVLIHGTDDPVVPVTSTQNAERTLKDAGIDCQTKFIPGLQHGIDGSGAQFAVEFMVRVIG